MSLQALSAPTRQAAAIEGRSAPLKVTGKLRVAVLAMIWEGSRRPDAATTAGLTDHSLRTALAKPHVKAFYNEQLEVLRTSAKARAIFRMTELSEQNKNMAAAVSATKELIGDADQSVARGSQHSSPGLVVIIQGPVQAKVIEHDPMETST